MVRAGGDEFGIGGQSERVTGNLQFGELGPSGCIEGLDFLVVGCGKDSPTIA